MKVLVACEYSGVVRDAFSRRGHDAMSCDLLPSDSPQGTHYQGDMFDLDLESYDLIISHPPCTHLCVSGNRWHAGTKERKDAAKFVQNIWDIPVERLVIENPIGVINTINTTMPKPQYIHPWQFGHGETKKTGLWKRGIPDLVPTNIVEGRQDRIHKMLPSKDRWKLRSTTYKGIAEAMAEQWGGNG